MIIKSLSRKAPSFGQLLGYMVAPEGARVDLRHNLPASAGTFDAVVAEFAENHALLPRRANGNALFHEILALPPDAGISTKRQVEALRHLATRYLARRAPQQLAVGVIHADTPHVHLHLMISSNAVLSRKREWLKKAEFAAIQRELEGKRQIIRLLDESPAAYFIFQGNRASIFSSVSAAPMCASTCRR